MLFPIWPEKEWVAGFFKLLLFVGKRFLDALTGARQFIWDVKGERAESDFIFYLNVYGGTVAIEDADSRKCLMRMPAVLPSLGGPRHSADTVGDSGFRRPWWLLRIDIPFYLTRMTRSAGSLENSRISRFSSRVVTVNDAE